MPLHCTQRPIRSTPRTWTPKSAARVVCRTLALGYSESEVKDALSDCLDVDQGEKCKKEKAAIEKAILAVGANNQSLIAADALVTGLDIFLGLVSRVGRFFPPLRVAATFAGAAKLETATVRSNIRIQRAANDALIRELRLAA